MSPKPMTKEQLKKAIAQSVQKHKSGQSGDTLKNETFSLPTKNEAQSAGQRRHLRKV
jgi:hypothetical protein